MTFHSYLLLRILLVCSIFVCFIILNLMEN